MLHKFVAKRLKLPLKLLDLIVVFLLLDIELILHLQGLLVARFIIGKRPCLKLKPTFLSLQLVLQRFNFSKVFGLLAHILLLIKLNLAQLQKLSFLLLALGIFLEKLLDKLSLTEFQGGVLLVLNC